MFNSTVESEGFTTSFKVTPAAEKLPFSDFTIKVIEAKTWPIDISL